MQVIFYFSFLLANIYEHAGFFIPFLVANTYFHLFFSLQHRVGPHYVMALVTKGEDIEEGYNPCKGESPTGRAAGTYQTFTRSSMGQERVFFERVFIKHV